MQTQQQRLAQALETCAEHGVPQTPNPWPDIRQQLLARSRRRWRVTSYALTLAAASLALALAAGLLSWGPAAVSAQEILARAYAAQQVQAAGSGIRHMRQESYQSSQAAPPGTLQRDVYGVSETYVELETGRVRRVQRDGQSGQLVDVFALDGSYRYTTGPAGEDGDSFTIYRAPISDQQIQGRPPTPEQRPVDHQALFEQARQAPNVELLGSERWIDGREAYLLRLPWPREGTGPEGYILLYFDVESYRLLEQRAMVRRAGQELLAQYDRWVVDETLPAGSEVAWDLSDLQGVQVVDDPTSDRGDVPPPPATEAQLAERAPGAYLLRSTPAGFEREIYVVDPAPGGLAEYSARYFNAAGDSFALSGMIELPPDLAEQAVERHTTAGGLQLFFLAPEGATHTLAIAGLADGAGFFITSNLPRERVKALAEDLAPVGK